jgi:hypothetical protein
MKMINEFMVLRLKVYEICQIFHEVMPDDYGYINLNDISISFDTELEEISVRNNCHFDNSEYLCFGIEWLNMSHFAITNIAKKLKYITKS